MNGGTLDEILREVPSEQRARFGEIVTLTDSFCDRSLNEEYKLLTRELACALCQTACTVNRGRAASWAAGVTYTISWVNLRFAACTSPHIGSKDIASGFGVSPTTMMAKARRIREALQIMRLDPEWCLPSMIGDNPLVWMVELDGQITDVRYAPREVQEKAHANGLIPYVPDDRQIERGTSDDVIAKIGPGRVLRQCEVTANGGPGFPGELLFGPGPAHHAAAKTHDAEGRAQVFVLRITLQRAKPPIWRRVAVSGDVTLGDLHRIIQAAMGWEDRQPHQFRTQQGDRFEPPRSGAGVGQGEHDEEKFRLRDVAGKNDDKLAYTYGVDACWEHQIVVQRVARSAPGGELPLCVAGRMACPPESVGGVWDYCRQLQALEDPEFARANQIEIRLPDGFDAAAFDLTGVNEQLRNLASCAHRTR